MTKISNFNYLVDGNKRIVTAYEDNIWFNGNGKNKTELGNFYAD